MVALDHGFRAQAGVTGHALEVGPAVVHGDLHATLRFLARGQGDRLLHESLQRGPVERVGLGMEVQQQGGGGGDDFPEPGLAQGLQRTGQGRCQGSPEQERRLIGALCEAHPPGVGAKGS
jgi:hypothetical protein